MASSSAAVLATAQLYCGPAVSISETATGGGFHPTRLACPSKSLSILGLGSDLVALHVPVLDEFSAASPDISSGDIETVTYVLPVRVDSLGRAAQYDIQTVAQGGELTACIDAVGGTHLYRLTHLDNTKSSNVDAKRARVESSLELDPFRGLPTVNSCEYGWAGASFRGDGHGLGVCHGLGRWVGLCDVVTKQKVNLGYLSRPIRGIGWFNENMLAFAESETMALWDVRSEAKTSTFSRCTPTSNGTLNCITGINNNLIACAGSDRVVYLIDDRTLRVVKHWRSPCKFDITSIHPSNCNPNLLYLSGLDNEIMTCDITPTEKKQQKQEKQKRRPKLGTTNSNQPSSVGVSEKGNGKEDKEQSAVVADSTVSLLDDEVIGGHGRLHQSHSLGIRGDARWIGVSLCSEDDGSSEVILGMCASGTLNVLRNPNSAKHARG